MTDAERKGRAERDAAFRLATIVQSIVAGAQNTRVTVRYLYAECEKKQRLGRDPVKTLESESRWHEAWGPASYTLWAGESDLDKIRDSLPATLSELSYELSKAILDVGGPESRVLFDRHRDVLRGHMAYRYGPEIIEERAGRRRVALDDWRTRLDAYDSRVSVLQKVARRIERAEKGTGGEASESAADEGDVSRLDDAANDAETPPSRRAGDPTETRRDPSALNESEDCPDEQDWRRWFRKGRIRKTLDHIASHPQNTAEEISCAVVADLRTVQRHIARVKKDLGIDLRDPKRGYSFPESRPKIVP